MGPTIYDALGYVILRSCRTVTVRPFEISLLCTKTHIIDRPQLIVATKRTNMANLADIPDDLLSAEQRIEFVSWLRNLPADSSIRIELASIWTFFTGKRLTPQQYNSIQE